MVEFEHSKSMLLPRQQYGIDYYGHANGNILVAIDLCTREVILWFTKSRSQDVIARCLLTERGIDHLQRRPQLYRMVCS